MFIILYGLGPNSKYTKVYLNMLLLIQTNQLCFFEQCYLKFTIIMFLFWILSSSLTPVIIKSAKISIFIFK